MVRTCSNLRVHEADTAPPAVPAAPVPDGVHVESVVDEAPAGPLPRSRRRFWLGVTGVAVLGAAVFGVAFADNFAALGAYGYRAPESFDGMRLRPEVSLAKQSTSLGGHSGVTSTGYQDPADSRGAVVMVYEKHIFLPSSELDDVVAAQDTEEVTLTGLRDVEPGERGGAMKCGLGNTLGKPVAVCAWADGSMWGVYVEWLPGRALSVDAVAARTREFRRTAEVPS
ncbi:hypothetical protein DR950_32640 [Kitasatospora xanthocidica]|uniref:Uncharacterized protein n=1 Tax=Kitasatospora xanthocidica TaxID=83382 RepID=A0A373A1B1_9ACTN|nr:hypothetical protein DR950_32640 [Kitasatospora xanthocidica]